MRKTSKRVTSKRNTMARSNTRKHRFHSRRLSVEHLECRRLLATVQILPDYNQTGSLADVVHIGDGRNDLRFLPRDAIGTSHTLPFSLTQQEIDAAAVLSKLDLSIDQYQADHAPEESFVILNGVNLGEFSFNPFHVPDLTGMPLPVVTDVFKVDSSILQLQNTLVIQAGLIGFSNYDDFSVTNIRLDLGSTADLIATDLTIDNGNVNFSYKIAGAALPDATTVNLYWSDDASFDSGDLNSLAYTETIAAGTMPTTVSRTLSIGALGPRKDYLILVTDPWDPADPNDTGKIAEASESNNVKAVEALPDLTPTEFKWDPQNGGVSYSFDIANFDLPTNPEVGIYWSIGTTFADAIGGPAYTVVLSPTATGSYGPFT